MNQKIKTCQFLILKLMQQSVCPLCNIFQHKYSRMIIHYHQVLTTDHYVISLLGQWIWGILFSVTNGATYMTNTMLTTDESIV